MSDNLHHGSFDVFWASMLNETDDDMETVVNPVVELSEDDFLKMYGFVPSEFDLDMDLEVNVLSDMSEASDPQEFVNISSSDVQKLIEDSENRNTTRKTGCDISKFKRFLTMKGESREIHDIDPSALDELLANYILSVRKPNGTEYEPSTIRSMISSIDRSLKRKKNSCMIMASETSTFQLTRDALKAKQKGLKRQGKGNRPQQASPITDSEIELMYQKKILGGNSPQSLLNTLWLNNCVHFGLRGTKENYQLRWGDISLKTAADGSEYLELNERQTKTRSGENLSDVRPVSPKMFTNVSDSDRDPIRFFKLYSSKRPAGYSGPDDPFYLDPRTVPVKTPNDQWFIKQKFGEKKLGKFMKVMATSTGLDPNKRLTNHSTRKHLVQKLRDSGVAPTDIMQISGHKNIQSIINYSSMSENQHRQCSNILSNSRQDKGVNTQQQYRAACSTTVTQENQSSNPAIGQIGDACSNSLIGPASGQIINHDNEPQIENYLSSETSGPTMSNMSLTHNTNQRSDILQSLFSGATLNIQNFNMYMR